MPNGDMGPPPADYVKRNFKFKHVWIVWVSHEPKYSADSEVAARAYAHHRGAEGKSLRITKELTFFVEGFDWLLQLPKRKGLLPAVDILPDEVDLDPKDILRFSALQKLTQKEIEALT